jgi:hypothetical protein
MSRRRLEVAWLVLALVLYFIMDTPLKNGRLANPYVTEAFVVVGGSFALYQAWRWFKGRKKDA